MFLLVFVVGIIGGTYDIGGGAIIAPFCVAVFHLPVYTVAGAALLGAFFTSIVGVFFYSVLPAAGEVATSPDRALGFLFGIRRFAAWISARLQKYVPQQIIKFMLSIMITSLAHSYIVPFLLG